MTIILPFPTQEPASDELRPSPKIVNDVLADALALIAGDAAEPSDAVARVVRIAALAIVSLDEHARRTREGGC